MAEHWIGRYFILFLLASELNAVVSRATRIIGRLFTTCDAISVLVQSCSFTSKHSEIAEKCPIYVCVCVYIYIYISGAWGSVVVKALRY